MKLRLKPMSTSTTFCFLFLGLQYFSWVFVFCRCCNNWESCSVIYWDTVCWYT